MSLKTCQYASCLEDIGDNGVIVSLRGDRSEKRAGFCCVAHAVAALSRLAIDRGEQKKMEASPTPLSWRVT